MLNVIVLIAMAIVAAAVAAALVVHAGMPLMVAAIGAAALYLVMASSFLMLARPARTGAPLDRLDEFEEALEIIDGDLQRIDRVEDDVARLGRLSDKVESLDRAFSEFGANGAAAGQARAQEFQAEFENVHTRIEGLRGELETETRSQREKIASDLRMLEGLITQLSQDLAARSAAHLPVAMAAEPRPMTMAPEPEPEPEPLATEEAKPEPFGLEPEPEPRSEPELLEPEPEPEPEPLEPEPLEARRFEPEASEPEPPERQTAEPERETAAEATVAEPETGEPEEQIVVASRSETLALVDDGIAVVETTETVATVEPTAPAEAEASKTDPAALMSEEELLDTLNQAIDAGRVELYLQPTFILPERKIRYYEGFTRIRTADDAQILPGAYLPVAEKAGIIPLVDNVLLVKSVQMLRRLGPDSKIKAIFCNMSMRSLLDPDFFPELVEFLEENAGLSENLIFEVKQPELLGLSPAELGAFDTLGALGFTFSLDHVGDFDVDFAGLSDRYFRFIKIDVNTYLHGMAEKGAALPPADMRRYLEGFGLQLVVEKIEDEASIERLLDWGVELAQGHLFAEPKPVGPALFRELEDADAA